MYTKTYKNIIDICAVIIQTLGGYSELKKLGCKSM